MKVWIGVHKKDEVLAHCCLDSRDFIKIIKGKDVLENELVKEAYIKQRKASGRGINAFEGFNGSTDTKGVAYELTGKAVLEATGSTGTSGVNGEVVGLCVGKGGRSLDKGGANAMIGSDRFDVNCLVNRVITKVGEDRVVIEKDQVKDTYILQRKASGGRGVNAMSSCYGFVDTKGVGCEVSGSNGMVVIEDSGSNGSDCLLSLCLASTVGPSSRPTPCGDWVAPPPGWLKLNSAVVSKSSSRSSSLGTVIRDDKGKIIAARARKIKGTFSKETGVLLALRDGLMLAKFLEIPVGMVEVDFSPVISILNSSGLYLGDASFVIQDIKALMADIGVKVCQVTSPVGNSLARNLGKSAFSSSREGFLLDVNILCRVFNG
ncbi:hypothetical protein EZV62_006389 [Acer yangbiense]|uniref:RNase H type-1 domain-containing protein n=1 Tax=Acer yangbiense TaxID=1000413 RepID=A0A5C7I7H8_9ROSI|nr:hypothetical protein EZV62_006389 [Acer yangbiense]